MVNIYNSIRDEDNNIIPGRNKLFIMRTSEDGSILDYLSGKYIVPEDSGTLLNIDDYVLEQVDKLEFINGELKVKDGETIDEPVKTEEELQEEELLRQLAELRARRTEGE